MNEDNSFVRTLERGEIVLENMKSRFDIAEFDDWHMVGDCWTGLHFVDHLPGSKDVVYGLLFVEVGKDPVHHYFSFDAAGYYRRFPNHAEPSPFFLSHTVEAMLGLPDPGSQLIREADYEPFVTRTGTDLSEVMGVN